MSSQGKPRKRPFTEVENLKSATSPSKSAKVHGVVTNLSPQREGSGFFQAKITDNTASIGFESSQWEELSKHNNKDPILLDDCAIRKSRYSESMEVVVNQNTKVTLSPRKIQPLKVLNQTITLKQLNDMEDFDLVTVAAKIMKASNKFEVKPGLFKQDISISDSTGTAQLAIWQDSIDSLTVGTLYSLQGLQVRSFNNSKYLSEPKSGFQYSVVEDIQAVMIDSDQQDEKVLNASITGAWVNNSRMCQACKGKIDIINDQQQM